MPFVPYTLTKSTKLFRTTPAGQQIALTVQAGTVVRHERTETEVDVFNVVRYTFDGYVWERAQRSPKQPPIVGSAPVDILTMIPATPPPVVAAPPAPVSAQTAAAVEATSKSAAHAVNVIAASRTHCNGDEKKIRGLARAAEMLRGDVYQVNYYIPASLNSEVENPSRVFRRYGFRLDGSNWVFPQHGLESRQVQKVLKDFDAIIAGYPPVDELPTDDDYDPLIDEDEEPSDEGGDGELDYWVVKYTAEQLAQMRESVHRRLAAELRKTHRSLIKRIDAAAQYLSQAQDELPPEATAKDREAIDGRYNARIRSTITEACERFQMCLLGAEIFDDTGSLDALFEARREAIAIRALAANAMLASKHVKTIAVPASIVGTPSRPHINPAAGQRG